MTEFLTALWIAFGALIAGADGDDDFHAFPESQDVMADVDALLTRARAADKLALIVLGANWCHDSEALVTRFDDRQMATILDQHYEVLLVNVGWLDTAFDVARRFGVPTVYHTPTVLVVEPFTEQLVNARDHFIWRDAQKITAEETLAYFTEQPEREISMPAMPDLMSETEARLRYEISEFEAAQVARIEASYDVIRPKLRDDAGDLMDLWRPLAKMRYRVPDDVLALQDEANERLEAGETEISLTYPEYPVLPWEE